MQEHEKKQKLECPLTQASKLENHEREWQQCLDRCRSGVESLRQQRDTANGAVTETKVAVAAEEQLVDSFHKQKQPLEQRIGELTQLLEQRRGEIAAFVNRKAQAEAENEASRQAIDRLQRESAQVRAQTAGVV